MKILNLGCGPKWKEQYPEYDGLDLIDYGQRWIGDVLDFFNINTYKGQSFTSQGFGYDEVMANHFLEHFNQEELKVIFSNVNRLLKAGGVFKFIVPHLKKEKAWILSHKTFWNETTINWLEEKEADSVYGLGKWKVKEVITNARKDIHAILKKIP